MVLLHTVVSAISGFLLACDWFNLNLVQFAYEHIQNKGHSVLTPFGNYVFVNAKFLQVFAAQNYYSAEWEKENSAFYDFIRKWTNCFQSVAVASRERARSEAILHCKPNFILACEVSRVLSLNPELIFKDPTSFLASAKESSEIQFLHMYLGHLRPFLECISGKLQLDSSLDLGGCVTIQRKQPLSKLHTMHGTQSGFSLKLSRILRLILAF